MMSKKYLINYLESQIDTIVSDLSEYHEIDDTEELYKTIRCQIDDLKGLDTIEEGMRKDE